ncbi:MAG: glutamate--tRNA ligase [Bacteroidales bacterium]|nr:glutamate--tRNA ligase [Bacteroidales bacterium]
MNQVRVRFAPSPTGPLHIGGLRTALFNYLFARKHDGKFILRIEDTDQARFVSGAEDYINEALEWCGILPDEGVGIGGEHGPYRQSERQAIYAGYAENLIETGKAYYAFDTPGELEEIRRSFEEKKETFTYDAVTRKDLRNSLNLSETETGDLLEDGTPYVIRFKFEREETITMKDLVRGEVKVDSNTLDDKILFKSDGMPTYHLANVVDDHLMGITHVIRGEEWLPSLPLHVSLYKAFGWKKSMPEFAHLPLILKPDGKGKLSKRDGDKGGFPVFPLAWTDPGSGQVSSGYREAGYFPETCLNILAFLGWNPGTEKELFTLRELVDHFDISRIGKAGAKFDPEKAKWFNHQYLQRKPAAEIAGLFQNDLEKRGIEADIGLVRKIVELVRERADFVSELWEHSAFFFMAPEDYDEKVVRKRWKEQTPGIMKELVAILASVDPFTSTNIEMTVKSEAEAREWGMGAVMNPWRLLMVGTLKGPSLSEMAEIIGKKEVISRIERGIGNIETRLSK